METYIHKASGISLEEMSHQERCIILLCAEPSLNHTHSLREAAFSEETWVK
jgi:hypothetical protein